MEKYNNLVVLKSLTKILAVPGLRLGMLFAGREIISNMSLLKTPWSINHFAVKVGEDIKRFDEFIKKSALEITTERKRFWNLLSDIKGLKVYNSGANYFLCRLDKKNDLDNLQFYLGSNKLLIRSCNNYPGLGKSFFRIAIKRQNENNLLVNFLSEYLNK